MGSESFDRGCQAVAEIVEEREREAAKGSR
jgi:hypothetical protein